MLVNANVYQVKCMLLCQFFYHFGPIIGVTIQNFVERMFRRIVSMFIVIKQNTRSR